MKAIKVYIQSFSTILRSVKLNSLIYLTFFIIALLLAIPFYRLFVSITENSLLAGPLLKGFNATAFGDIIRADGKVFSVYFKGLWPWLLAFWIIGVYFYGGIIHWIANPRGAFVLRTFLDKSGQYFWRFFRLAFYVLVIQAIVALLIYVLPVILAGKEGMTDQYIIRTISIGIMIHLVFMITISMIADFTRFGLYQNNNKKVLRGMWKSFKFVVRHLGALWMIYLIWLVLPLAMMLGFYLLRTSMNIDSSGLIIGLFVIQQIFIWLRFLLRIQKQGMFFNYYILDQVAE